MTNPSHITAPSNGEPQPDTLCACGHAVEAHDLIASRYCRATVASALDRACMCSPASVPLTR
jgi:hypothetical protein